MFFTLEIIYSARMSLAGLLTRFLDSDIFSPGPPQDLIFCSFVVSLLVGVLAPTFAATTPVPLLLSLGVTGLCYFAFVVRRGAVLEGVFGGLFALSTFSAEVPVIQGVRSNDLEILLVDPVLLAALVILAILYSSGRVQRPTRLTLLPFLFGAFVGWTGVSALVGNGPSQSVAVFFSIGRARMLALLLGVFAITTIYGFRDVMLAFLPPLAVHVAVALAEGLHGAAFGFTVLGDKTGDLIANKTLFGLSYSTGLFPGGFIGTSRALLAVLFLLAPVTAVILADRFEGKKRWWSFTLVPTTIILVFADTASGLGAFVFLLVIIMIFEVLMRFRSDGADSSLAATGVSLLSGLTFITIGQFSKDQTETSFADSSSDGSTSRQTPSAGSTEQEATPTPNGTTDGQDATPTPNGTTDGQDATPTQTELGFTDLLPSFVVENLQIRIWLVFTAVEVALNYPVFGLGGANFQLLTRELGLEFGLTAHNTFLSVLVEFGFPGFFLFMSAVGYTYYATIGLAWKQPVRREMWLMILAGLISFHAFNFWVSLYYSTTVYAIFWMVAAAVAGEYATTCTQIFDSDVSESG